MNGAAAAPAADETPSEMQEAIDRKTEELRALEEPMHAAATVNGAVPIDPDAKKAASAVLDAQTRQIVGVTILGILVSCPGVPPDAICRSIARVAGALLADAVTADLRLMLQHRAGIKEAFKVGIDSTKIGSLTAPPPKR